MSARPVAALSAALIASFALAVASPTASASGSVTASSSGFAFIVTLFGRTIVISSRDFGLTGLTQQGGGG